MALTCRTRGSHHARNSAGTNSSLMQPLVVAFLVAALSAAVITPLVIGGANRWHLFDAPDDTRHLHEPPVPRLGGVAVFIATMLGIASTLLYAPARQSLAAEAGDGVFVEMPG